jgi:hypothetical protein
MSYDENDSEALTGLIDRAAAESIDVSGTPIEMQNKALRAVVKALETGLKIVHEIHYAEARAPEPFPGACKAVVEQGLAGIALARKGGLIP